MLKSLLGFGTHKHGTFTQNTFCVKKKTGDGEQWSGELQGLENRFLFLKLIFLNYAFFKRLCHARDARAHSLARVYIVK